MLVFMIQSVRSKYKDVVKIVPVESLNEQLLQRHFMSVLQALSEIFFVISATSDNHVVNRLVNLI